MFRWIRRLIGLASAYKEAEDRYGKKWYRSKTLWVNLIALISLFLNEKVGVPISESEQMAILSVVNIVLRLVTKEPVRW